MSEWMSQRRYIAECKQCAAGTLVTTFVTAEERTAWVRYHTIALGHVVTTRELEPGGEETPLT